MPAIIARSAPHALRYRRNGFGPGLVILTCMGNLGPALLPADVPLALVHGGIQMARDSFDGPPRRVQRPLPTLDTADQEHLTRWFRLFIEDREAAGAERCVRTAVAADWPLEDVVGMLLAGATDHFFLSTGHVVDFLNKAWEMVDLIGEEHAADVLSGVVPPMATAFRHEESADWMEFVAPLHAVFAELPALVAAGAGKRWDGADALLAIALGDAPHATIAAFRDAIADGATITDLTRVLCRAGVYRVARFPLQNEEDWDDVLHVISYCHALDSLAHRIAGRNDETDRALLRAIFHGALFVYLTYFLNIPRAELPAHRNRVPTMIADPHALTDRLDLLRRVPASRGSGGHRPSLSGARLPGGRSEGGDRPRLAPRGLDLPYLPDDRGGHRAARPPPRGGRGDGRPPRPRRRHPLPDRAETAPQRPLEHPKCPHPPTRRRAGGRDGQLSVGNRRY